MYAVFDTIKLDERGLTEFPQFRPYIRNATRARRIRRLRISMMPHETNRHGFSLRAVLHARSPATAKPHRGVDASAAYLA